MTNVPKQDFSKARTFKIIGWIFIIAGGVLAVQSNILVSIIPAGIGILLLQRGMKYTVERGEPVLKNDIRPPVLYLRSFQDEEKGGSVSGQFSNFFYALKKYKTFDSRSLAQTVPFHMTQEQGALAHILRKIGPYIALGKPGEELPELGSSKLYVANEGWQNTILDFLRNAKLIIFNAGKTEGLKWELNQLIQTVSPVKVLMIMPVRDEDYFSFISWANTILPVSFPGVFPPCRLVMFNDEWEPFYLKQEHTLTKSLKPFFDQNQITIKETFWEKTLEHNGLRW